MRFNNAIVNKLIFFFSHKMFGSCSAFSCVTSFHRIMELQPKKLILKKGNYLKKCLCRLKLLASSEDGLFRLSFLFVCLLETSTFSMFYIIFSSTVENCLACMASWFLFIQIIAILGFFSIAFFFFRFQVWLFVGFNSSYEYFSYISVYVCITTQNENARIL